MEVRRTSAKRFYSMESPDFSARLREGLKLGLSWPQARNRALLSMDICSCFKEDSLSRLLGSPNNLLGIEYCKPFPAVVAPSVLNHIQRKGQGYHDKTLESGQASASAIRKSLLASQPEKKARSHEDCVSWEPPISLSSHIPPHILPLYSQGRILRPEDCAGLRPNCRLFPIPYGGSDCVFRCI